MSDFEVVIIGAGLVGALAAISFARQGYKVSLFESRSDPRQSSENVGRSINLAVSARAIETLRSIDVQLCERVLAGSIAMKGRMIHVGDTRRSQIYGLFGECIHSVDRTRLNSDLLKEAEGYESVNLYFNHKLVRCDFANHMLSFEVNDGASRQTLTVRADLTIGCDGAFSTVRTAMLKAQRMDFSQEYIQHGYLELSISPSPSGNYQLESDHLHIWPRQEYMLIALPNPDHSFTSTFFAPFTLFDSLTSDEAVLNFFHAEFEDAVNLIGDENLLSMWKKNPIAPLIQVSCFPFHYKDRVILLGDSTHAMVPFYGQGMNCGFEDLRVLNSILRMHGICPAASWELEAALAEYSETRQPDLMAIQRLAMGNYIEMRSSVTSRVYLLRKFVDSVLGRLLRNIWVPMYTMVSFRADISYTEVIARERRQHRVFLMTLGATSLTICTFLTGRILQYTSLKSWKQMLHMGLRQLVRGLE